MSQEFNDTIEIWTIVQWMNTLGCNDRQYVMPLRSFHCEDAAYEWMHEQQEANPPSKYEALKSYMFEFDFDAILLDTARKYSKMENTNGQAQKQATQR